MALGTDAEILVNTKEIIKGNGRPSINRELAFQMLKARKPQKFIVKVLKCSHRSYVRLVKEFEKEQGSKIQTLDEEKISKASLVFDTECFEAVGISFKEWLLTRVNKEKARDIFSFTNKCWITIFGKADIHLIRDRDNPLSDQLAIKFLSVFGEDKQRIRRRKKIIRYIFRFLGREDINNRHLTMSRARDPNEIREVPQMSFVDFPLKLDQAIQLASDEIKANFGAELGEETELLLKLKLVTQIRTGKKQTGKELWGIKKGANAGSYLTMNSIDEYRFRILAKQNESWDITYLPYPVRKLLFKLYEKRKEGEQLFKIAVEKVREAWTKATEKVGLPPLHLHDLRKASITFFYVMGIPLEIATSLNVGWRDLNTARDYYLQYRGLLKREKKVQYRINIPSWFKDGLNEYMEG